MKLLILSDLHCEFAAFERPATAIDKTDVIVLAGDIDTKHRAVDRALELTGDSGKPVILIAGNHEFYGDHFDDAIEKLRERATATNGLVQFLENDVVLIDGVRFLGTTLWTDFKLYETRGMPARYAGRDAEMGLTDYKKIRAGTSYRKLSAIDTSRRYQESVRWILDQKSFDGKTVMVTHHAPSERSISDEFVGNELTPAYASNLEYAMGGIDLWIHGHMHSSSDYLVRSKCDLERSKMGTRVVCNPRGYAPRHLNPDFNPNLLIEI